MAMATVPTFTYRGLDSAGKKVKGELEAASESQAIQQLKAKGIVPSKMEEKGAGAGLQKEINIPALERGPKLKDLAIMTRQMATMVGAGVSILKTLDITRRQTENPKLKKIMAEVAAQVESGIPFSTALAEHSVVIPPIMVHLIRAGETGGFLDKSLLMVADNFEAETKLQSKVKSALTYPIVVLVVALLAVAAMLIFIVPVFEKMFHDFGGQLPAPTQLLVNMSNAMPIIAPVTIVVVGAFMFWWNRNKNSETVRRFVDPIKLKVPVFGNLNRKIALTRFTRNFSTMLASGVPILQSLDIVGDTAGNMVISDAIVAVQEEVRQGEPIAVALTTSDVFPDMLVQMVGIGEESGAIDVMLEKVADFYDDEVETVSSQLTALLEPLMIVFMGSLLGFMIVSLYMPMFMIFQQMQKMGG